MTAGAEAGAEVGGLRGAEAPLFHVAARGALLHAVPCCTWFLARRRTFTDKSSYRAGSFTKTMRSPVTLRICCTIPEGQWISTRSADAFCPNPKCTGPALDDA
jgi:hypothetical protein